MLADRLQSDNILKCVHQRELPDTTPHESLNVCLHYDMEDFVKPVTFLCPQELNPSPC